MRMNITKSKNGLSIRLTAERWLHIVEKFLAVVYKEITKEDGFIITSYFTSKIKLEKEAIVWRKK